MSVLQISYRDVLQNEFLKRKRINPSYSLNAFSSFLKVNSGTLSRIFNQKLCLSFKMAKELLQKLELDQELEKAFLHSVVEEQKNRKLQRKDPKVTFFKTHKVANYVENKDYLPISEWYYAAIMEMTFLPEFKPEPKFVANFLGIDYMEAKIALKRLFDSGRIYQKNGQTWKTDQSIFTTQINTTAEELKRKQRKIREKAITAIDEQKIDNRSMTTVTMCIDPDLISEAKKKIVEFNQSLCEFLESGEQKKVYVMEVSLFDLEKQGKEK